MKRFFSFFTSEHRWRVESEAAGPSWEAGCHRSDSGWLSLPRRYKRRGNTRHPESEREKTKRYDTYAGYYYTNVKDSAITHYDIEKRTPYFSVKWSVVWSDSLKAALLVALCTLYTQPWTSTCHLTDAVYKDTGSCNMSSFNRPYKLWYLNTAYKTHGRNVKY